MSWQQLKACWGSRSHCRYNHADGDFLSLTHLCVCLANSARLHLQSSVTGDGSVGIHSLLTHLGTVQ